jgi:DNA-binding MarR family transcriptional regulator
MNRPDRTSGPASKARLRLWLRLLRLSRMIEGEVRERLRVEHATTLPRFDVLAALYRAEDGLRMSELSGALRVSNGNVTGIVDRLVADGLVERVPVEDDRRAMRVRLGIEGRAVFSMLAAHHEGWIDEIFSSVDGPEAEALSDTLRAIAARIDEEGTIA